MREHDLDHAIDASHNFVHHVDYRGEHLIDRLELDLKNVVMDRDSVNARCLQANVRMLRSLALKFELLLLRHTAEPQVEDDDFDATVPF